MQIVSTFLDQDLFIVNISWAGAYYLYTGTPSLEPKHEKIKVLKKNLLSGVTCLY